MTIQEYQKQHRPLKRALPKSPVMNDVDKGNVRRKLTLEDDANNGENSKKVVQVTHILFTVEYRKLIYTGV